MSSRRAELRWRSASRNPEFSSVRSAELVSITFSIRIIRSSIWLDIDLKVLNERIKWNKKRPLLNEYNNQKRINEIYDERKSIYKLADYKILCNDLTEESIAKKIITYYEDH